MDNINYNNINNIDNINNINIINRLIKEYPKWGREFLIRNPEYKKYIKL